MGTNILVEQGAILHCNLWSLATTDARGNRKPTAAKPVTSREIAAHDAVCITNRTLDPGLHRIDLHPGKGWQAGPIRLYPAGLEDLCIHLVSSTRSRKLAEPPKKGIHALFANHQLMVDLRGNVETPTQSYSPIDTAFCVYTDSYKVQQKKNQNLLLMTELDDLLQAWKGHYVESDVCQRGMRITYEAREPLYVWATAVGEKKSSRQFVVVDAPLGEAEGLRRDQKVFEDTLTTATNVFKKAAGPGTGARMNKPLRQALEYLKERFNQATKANREELAFASADLKQFRRNLNALLKDKPAKQQPFHANAKRALMLLSKATHLAEQPFNYRSLATLSSQGYPNGKGSGSDTIPVGEVHIIKREVLKNEYPEGDPNKWP